jgi:hypothetical protein
MAIKILRLLSGEEVLGDVFYDKEKETYLIKDPVVLRWMPTKDDPEKPTLNIASLIPHADEDDITIQAQHVLFKITPLEELVNEYNSVYGSGIIRPPKNELIS